MPQASYTFPTLVFSNICKILLFRSYLLTLDPILSARMQSCSLILIRFYRISANLKCLFCFYLFKFFYFRISLYQCLKDYCLRFFEHYINFRAEAAITLSLEAIILNFSKNYCFCLCTNTLEYKYNIIVILFTFGLTTFFLPLTNLKIL